MMESNEDSKSLSEESTDESEDQIGTGRSYECVFCKRGFTTAQALGGHMNIHRKDRAKTRRRPANSSVNKVVDDDDNYNFKSYPHYSTPSPHHHVNNYKSFFPAPTWLVTSPIHDHHQSNYPFGDAWSEDLSLQLGPTSRTINDEEKRQAGCEEDDLDLELRLGHT